MVRQSVFAVLSTLVFIFAASAVGHAQAPAGQAGADSQARAAAPAQDAPPREAETPDGLRFRFGVALELASVAASTGEVGLGVGLDLRLGLQFNRWFGIYYQPRGIVGGWVSGDEASGVMATLLNTAMFELTFPLFHIGLGPSIDVLSVAGCSTDTTNVACQSGSDVFFGLDMRIALVIGSFGPGPNGGFSINLHPHLTFVGDEVVGIVSLGFGGELY